MYSYTTYYYYYIYNVLYPEYYQMVNMESCLELENQPTPETTGDPIFDLLPPQEYIIAFVVPALIIVGMLLLAVLIACILHK